MIIDIMKVGIVGSRFFDDFAYLEKIVNYYESKNGTITTIISGGAKGADSLAEKYAEKYHKKLVIHHAIWKKNGVYNPRAGLERNTLIVNDADYIIAFPSKTSKGTYDTINKAEKAGVRVKIHIID
jgi:hypothetical protein